MDYKSYSSAALKLAHKGLSALLPPRCPVNGRIVSEAGAISPEAWGQLTFISAPLCRCCGFPFPVADTAASPVFDDFLCGDCLETPKPYQSCRSALAYDDASRSLILAFKHGDQTLLAKFLAGLMVRSGADILAGADVLVPVPLHWRRLVMRRYNQSALLARQMSVLSGVPVDALSLVRTRATASQGHKTARERLENVGKAFAVPSGRIDRVEGKSVVLIDDVLTTGATIGECSKALLEAGARSVDVLTVARVVKAH